MVHTIFLPIFTAEKDEKYFNTHQIFSTSIGPEVGYRKVKIFSQQLILIKINVAKLTHEKGENYSCNLYCECKKIWQDLPKNQSISQYTTNNGRVHARIETKNFRPAVGGGRIDWFLNTNF